MIEIGVIGVREEGSDLSLACEWCVRPGKTYGR